MYVTNFPAYSELKAANAVSNRIWVALWNGFKHRDIDPRANRYVPLVQLGDDPERMDAARELKKLLHGSKVETDDGVVLDRKGATWVYDGETRKLIIELKRSVKSRFFGLDDVDDGVAFDDAFKERKKEDDRPTNGLYTITVSTGDLTDLLEQRAEQGLPAPAGKTKEKDDGGDQMRKAGAMGGGRLDRDVPAGGDRSGEGSHSEPISTGDG